MPQTLTQIRKANGMSEYDNTNRGAAFPPFDDQKLILSGKINYHGTDRNVVLVSGSTKDGKKKIEMYQKVGILFENDRKDKPAQPDYTGMIDNSDLRMSAWRGDNDGKPYLSYQVSVKQDAPQAESNVPQSQQQVSGQPVEDSVPF